jgi:hypothetical protein
LLKNTENINIDKHEHDNFSEGNLNDKFIKHNDNENLNDYDKINVSVKNEYESQKDNKRENESKKVIESNKNNDIKLENESQKDNSIKKE